MSRRRLRCGCWRWVSCIARRAVELVERDLWCTDPTAAVAAEISAVQNISHARAVGQIWYGRTLRERLPSVARVFVRGTIDMRMVLTIIARTENVDDTVIAQLDEAIARHCEKWMKLSKDKLRDRVDHWVAKFDPAGVRVAPVVDEGRYIEVAPGASCGHSVCVRACARRGRRGIGSRPGRVGCHGV